MAWSLPKQFAIRLGGGGPISSLIPSGEFVQLVGIGRFSDSGDETPRSEARAGSGGGDRDLLGEHGGGAAFGVLSDDPTTETTEARPVH